MAKQTVPFVLEEFFSGKLVGSGFLLKRSGGLKQTFTIQAQGEIASPGILKLVERYEFDDGSTDTLAWTMRRLSENTYEGQEARLVGRARGSQSGSTFHWRYRRKLAKAQGGWTVSFDDWFWRHSESVVLASAQLSRFGIGLGSMSVVYTKL